MGGASMGVKWTYDTIGELVELKVGELSMVDAEELAYKNLDFLRSVLRRAELTGNADMAKFVGVIALLGGHISGLEKPLLQGRDPIHTTHNMDSKEDYLALAHQAFNTQNPGISEIA